MPPHGKADKVVPAVTSVTCVEKATQLGAGAELDGDADVPPPLFCNVDYPRPWNTMFLASVMRMHEFLESLVDGQARPRSMNPQTFFPSIQSDLATRMTFVGLLDQTVDRTKNG